MLKKNMVILLVVILVLGSTVGVYADSVESRLANYKENYDDQYIRILKLKSDNRDEQLKMLQDLKILKGTGNGLELDRGLTRAEGASVYLRLFGEEVDCKEFGNNNPDYKTGFMDIPAWALNTINYLYNNNIVVGVNAEKFGSNDPMTAEQFTTLVLRGLGYKDSEGEFTWNESLEKAVEVEILSKSEKEEIEKDKLFTRDEMATIAYNSMFVKLKDTPKVLLSNSVRSLRNDCFAQIFYEILNDEEVEELRKSIKTTGYIVFGDNPEKRQLLLDKVQSMLDTYSEFYKIYLDDTEIKLRVKKVNDIGNLPFSETVKEYAKIIKFTIEVEAPTIDKVELDTFQVWKLDGNKLELESDKNYFWLMGQDLIIEHMRTLKKDIVHVEGRLGKNFEAGGIEDFAKANDLRLDKGAEIRRWIFSYDKVKMADTIMILKKGSLDYHMYIKLMK